MWYSFYCNNENFYPIFAFFLASKIPLQIFPPHYFFEKINRSWKALRNNTLSPSYVLKCLHIFCKELVLCLFVKNMLASEWNIWSLASIWKFLSPNGKLFWSGTYSNQFGTVQNSLDFGQRHLISLKINQNFKLTLLAKRHFYFEWELWKFVKNNLKTEVF